MERSFYYVEEGHYRYFDDQVYQVIGGGLVGFRQIRQISLTVSLLIPSLYAISSKTRK